MALSGTLTIAAPPQDPDDRHDNGKHKGWDKHGDRDDDDHHPGWYLLFNARLGRYVHVEYFGIH